MPGYLYVFGVMTAGLLSVLLLALRTEKSSCRAVEEALAKLPGLRGEDRLFAGRRGLAVDRRHRALCLICAETETVRLHVVPFADLLSCELLVAGQLVARADASGGSLQPPSPDIGAAADVRLRLRVADHYAPRHEFVVDDLATALRWQAELGLVVGRDTEAASEPRSSEGTATNTEPQAAPAGDAPVAPALRAGLRRYLHRELAGRDCLVIPERRLRDCCASQLPLIRFHEQMNRLRRAKAVDGYRLSYSRKNEMWRITRREASKAA